jgi:prepilin-type processing-associated H-X9-DG protein
MALIEIVVVLVVIVILVGMIVPAGRVKDRDHDLLKCSNNLKTIGVAYRIWATDNGDHYPFNVSTNDGGTLELRHDILAQFRVLSNELSTPKIVYCPRLNPKVTEATSWVGLTATSVGYFIGLNGSQTNAASILAGDIGFTINDTTPRSGINEVRADARLAYGKDIHGGLANICLGDGSVSRFKNNEWPKYLNASGAATNLFLLP